MILQRIRTSIGLMKRVGRTFMKMSPFFVKIKERVNSQVLLRETW
ncbi:MAG TPA: hypothetical protein O0X73_00675 [Methanocorpusculum sp.]|nr:hypothetical protein [Methanocorpusculum sp.]